MNDKIKSQTVEDLEKLDGQLGAEGVKEGPANPEDPDLDGVDIEDVSVTPEEAASALITYANEEFKKLGLTPIGTLQRFLLRASIIGVAKKYHIEKFDLLTYPELGLAISAGWISLDKYREYQAKHPPKPAAAPAAKEPSAPVPPEEAPSETIVQ
jgi:hypothetical protein